MASLPRNLKSAALLGVACTALSSCTLPPREAWRKIQTDGLIAYIDYEIKTPRHGAPAPPIPGSSAPAPGVNTPAPSPVLVQRTPSMQDSRGVKTALTVPGLPGYVRSPYTNPPRLVDVRGVDAGTTMVCPYTHQRFLVPGAGAAASPRTVVAENKSVRVEAPAPTTPPVVRPTPAPTVVLNNKPVETPSRPAPAEKKSDIPSPPKVASTPAAPLVKPAPAPAPTTPAPAKPQASPTPSAPTVTANKPNTPPAVNTPPATAPAPAPKPVQEIPYGTAIAGRPGFVNSPYAAAHQLVDVTGLPSGMEVKCPYTGKLFRVPMKDVASGKPETVAPLTSPAPAKK